MTAARSVDLEAARECLRDAKHVLVFTGAGVSAESGVPTFRGESGLWKEYRPEELANPRAFERDPRLVWEWYGWRRQLIASCRPNPAHRAIARAQLEIERSVRVVTQNVDGLHLLALADELDPSDAAAPGAQPVEVHGSIFRIRCLVCGLEVPDRGDIDASARDTLPSCLECGSLMRPAVVWFGESLDPIVLDSAFSLAAHADACLVVGTSAVVYPAAGIPRATLAAGGTVIEVNPEPTPLSASAALSLVGPAGEILPYILG